MIRAIFFLSGVALVLRLALIQANQFLDSANARFETAVVISSDVTYRPFRVDHLTVRSADGIERSVPVLPKRAASERIGAQIEIAIGDGVLGKAWVAPADKHREYDHTSFRIVYLGIFACCLAFLSWAYYRGVTRLQSASRHGLFAAGIVVGVICFYVF